MLTDHWRLSDNLRYVSFNLKDTRNAKVKVTENLHSNKIQAQHRHTHTHTTRLDSQTAVEKQLNFSLSVV